MPTETDVRPGLDHGFLQRGEQVIVLLAGGSKRNQKRDIKHAKALAALLD
jgi:putative addiction module killer protein